jgi:hypothetical protein
LGATGEAVRRLERALRRTPDLGLTVDGVFSAQLETVVRSSSKRPASWPMA